MQVRLALLGLLGRLSLSAVLAWCTACAGTGIVPWKAPTTRDTKDDPASVRPGHCSTELPFWSPLTAAEADALRAVAAARSGDARALASLAIMASGDRRAAADYQTIHERIDRFVSEVRPSVEGAQDDWHRGYELHRAMHRVLFKSQGNGLDRYELNQSRLTTIFDTNRYNCISSAMLFTVLARNFSMPVRGVSVPTHAFSQLDLPDGKVLEIETTSNTGFDHVHDERFYREGAAQWSSSRGLAPVTFEQYQGRKLLEPYQLMALGMLNQAALLQGKAQARLGEAAAFVDPRNNEAARMRLQLYVNEADELQKRGAANTTVKLFECVKPAIQETAQLWAKDSLAMRLSAWAAWYYADALAVVGRGQHAVAIARTCLLYTSPSPRDS